MSYQPITGRISAEDAATERDPLFAPTPRNDDHAVLDWFEAFAAQLGAELDNYLAGWDETCKRRGLPAERRVFFAKV